MNIKISGAFNDSTRNGSILLLYLVRKLGYQLFNLHENIDRRYSEIDRRSQK